MQVDKTIPFQNFNFSRICIWNLATAKILKAIEIASVVHEKKCIKIFSFISDFATVRPLLT